MVSSVHHNCRISRWLNSIQTTRKLFDAFFLQKYGCMSSAVSKHLTDPLSFVARLLSCTATYSRRGLPMCGDIDIILFHPLCTYVPRPGEKLVSCEVPSSEPEKSRRGRPRKHVTPSRAKQDNLLRDSILGPLERAGILAATLTEGPRKWQGIARIPSDEHSESKQENHIYRRMDLSYVHYCNGRIILLN